MVSSCSHSTGQHYSPLNTSGPSANTAEKEAKADEKKDERNLADFSLHVRFAAQIAGSTSSNFSGAFGKEMQNAFAGTGITV